MTATIGGQNVTIGTITASIGTSSGHGSEQTTFAFTGGYGSLDKSYDFHWVQMIQQCGTATFYNYNSTQTFSTATAPFIDAPPGGYSYEVDYAGRAGDDNAPFYEHEDTLFAPSGAAFYVPAFAFSKTHTEGKTSRIADNPTLGFNGGTFQATDFLVVTSPENANGTFTPGTFDVLNGYTWTETFGANNSVTPGGPVFLDADPTLVNLALSNTKFASAWQAVSGADLAPAPEPSAAWALLAGTLGLCALRVRRRVQCRA